jgi:hypothetical protein
MGYESADGVYTIPEVTVEGDPVGEDGGAPAPDLDFNYPGGTMESLGHIGTGIADAVVEGAEAVGTRVFVPTQEMEHEIYHTPDDA